MNKNKKILLICIIALAVTLVTANAGYCDTSKAEQNQAIFKFFMAMGGVVISSFLLFAVLSLYNKFIIDKRYTSKSSDTESLTTPKNVDDAITGFIKRNKLQ